MAHLGVKVQGRTEAEIATEITNDLEVRLEDMAYKHGTSNIDEIERQLNDDAKEQLENYKNTNTVPTHPEAKELAIMSKELKYIERVAKDKKFELSFDGKYEGTANSTGEVVSKITNMRERKDIEKQQDTRKRA